MTEKTTRGDRIWASILQARDHGGVSLSRARLYTESWKKSDGEPSAVRRGLAMKNVLENIPLYVDDEQLLMGAFASKSMWAEWYPEYESKFLLRSADNEPALNVFDRGMADPDEIHAIAEYWAGKSIEDKFLDYVKPEDLEALQLISEDNAFINSWNVNRSRHGGYYCVDMEKAVTKGFRAIIADMDAELAALHIHDHQTLLKAQNLRGWKLALEGGIAYGRRCAALCRETADACANEARKAELLKMEQVCGHVPEFPARDFQEALQMVVFVHMFIYLETRGDGVSPGRADQYLYPCYCKSKELGMTEEQAIDLLQCFRIKFNTFRQLSGKRFFENTSGEAQFHNITIGGTDGDGSCAVNELSYLFLEAAGRLRTPHPTLSMRCYEGMPRDFLQKGLEVVALGGGYPAFFNDKSCIDTLLRYGVAPQDAKNYAVGGCVLAQVPGKTGPGYPVVINMAKCMELAMHDGYDHYKSKKQIGPHTGAFASFKSFGEFYDAFKTQVAWASEVATGLVNIQRAIREYMMPSAFTDTLMDDCIKKGLTATGAGPKYQLQYHNARCMIDAVDSLAAVKKCVFEDKTVSQAALEDILIRNYKNAEDVRALLQKAPKYGNDDDYADALARDVYHWWGEMVQGLDAGFGDKYLPGAYTVGAHVTCGHNTGALPDGRYEDDPLADGSVSPCQGADACGPTAVMNSADKIDQYEFTSTLLNIKFTESSLKTPEDREKLAALILAYFEDSGKHVQFNVVDRATLLDAKAHPERHRDLLVRVAGYSAFFVELLPNLQNEIILRTENTL